jgi:hypothetical protein
MIHSWRVMDLPWPMMTNDVMVMVRSLDIEMRTKVALTSLTWLESPQDAGAD